MRSAQAISRAKKKYYQTHKEKIKVYMRKYYHTHKEAAAISMKKWYAKNKEKQKVYCKQWHRDNRDKINASIRKTGKKYRIKMRLELLDILGHSCIKCGFADPRALQIDHINDDGYLDRKWLSVDVSFYTYYCKHPDEARRKLQTLCANCNTIKKFDKEPPDYLMRWNSCKNGFIT